jgi:uncharacterized SAM-binding protein YcdF (DUF218 family)
MIRLLVTLLGYGVAVAFLAWLAGFALFLRQVPEAPQPVPVDRADAIVVLTGGAARVTEGLELIERGLADKLLISGVGKGVTVKDVLANHAKGRIRDALEKMAKEKRIDLGYDAQNTTGNALEVADWVKSNEVQRFYLVTAYYHLPRALLELGHALPEASILPYAVFPFEDKGELPSRWTAYRLLWGEYHKYGLSIWRLYIHPYLEEIRMQEAQTSV